METGEGKEQVLWRLRARRAISSRPASWSWSGGARPQGPEDAEGEGAGGLCSWGAWGEGAAHLGGWLILVRRRSAASWRSGWASARRLPGIPGIPGCLCVRQIQPSGWARWAPWPEGMMGPLLSAAACPLRTEPEAPGDSWVGRWEWRHPCPGCSRPPGPGPRAPAPE